MVNLPTFPKSNACDFRIHFPSFRKHPTKSGWCRRRSDDFQTIQNVPEDFQRLANVAVRCAKSWRHLAEIAHLYFSKDNRARIRAPTPKTPGQSRHKTNQNLQQCHNVAIYSLSKTNLILLVSKRIIITFAVCTIRILSETMKCVCFKSNVVINNSTVISLL